MNGMIFQKLKIRNAGAGLSNQNLAKLMKRIQRIFLKALMYFIKDISKF